jgi:alpha-L-fucosidase 2
VSGHVELQWSWAEFLSGHDMIWEEIPTNWEDRPFLGNGLMGTMLSKQPERHSLRLDVFRSDVQDHRDDAHGAPGFSRARLPIGYFLLEFAGEISSGYMRLDLWNAELNGYIETNQGRVDFNTIVHAEEMAIIVEIIPHEGEQNCKWVWHAAEAVSPRQTYGIRHNDSQRTLGGYALNPSPLMKESDDMSLCLQALLAGGQTATCWKEYRDEVKRTLVITTAHSPDGNAEQEAVNTVSRLSESNREELWAEHRRYWHSYYPQSFITIPDVQLESFYWIQMYKLASATRADRALIDNQGPWLDETPWPFATWNLNVQLTYWPTYASNRLALSESLWRTLHERKQALIDNVPEACRHDSAGIGTSSAIDLKAPTTAPGTAATGFVEAGNLTWALHNCWIYYRMTMDDSYLGEVFFPLLKRAISYYLHFLYEDEEQRLHLRSTSSPEYGVVIEDCNYDLALLRWGCETLIYCSSRLGVQDQLKSKWEETIEKLVDYPEKDDAGFMIGKGQPYEKSHRHYSHLLMIYPLYLVHAEQPGGKERIERSLEHWQSKPEYLEGYSCTGAASIAASLGKGDEALTYLQGLWKGFLSPATMYKELGPVIETPLSAAQTIHDMLLQSWGNTIRVFPAVPDNWKDAAYHNMRAEGGFLVTAVRKNGVTQFIQIKSIAGEPCRIKSDLTEAYAVISGRSTKIRKCGEDILQIDLNKGEEIILCREGGGDTSIAQLGITPCQHAADQLNSYGVNDRTRVQRNHSINPQL